MGGKHGLGAILMIMLLVAAAIFLYIGVATAEPLYSKTIEGSVIRIDFGGSALVEFELIDNTNYCISDCESTIRIRPHKDISLPVSPDSDYGWLFEKSHPQAAGLEGYGIYIRESKEYNVSMPLYGDCQSFVEYDPRNTTCQERSCADYNQTHCNCTAQCITGYRQETRSRDEYVPFSFWGSSLSADNDYYIKLKGRKRLSLGENNIDWKIRFSSVLIDDWAWWNSSWYNYVNYTFTDSLVPDINRTGEPVSVNVTGLMLNTNNCTEIALVNSTGGQINYAVKSNGTTGMPDGSKWCLLEHQITKMYNQSEVNYSYYYNSSYTGNDHPQANYVTKTAGANSTYTGANWEGAWDDASGIGFESSTFKDASQQNWTQGSNWGIFNMYNGSVFLRPAYTGGSTSHNGCNPVYCELDTTGGNCSSRIRLFDRYIVYDSIACNSTYEVYFLSAFGASKQVCRYSDESCTNSNYSWGSPEKGYWYNQTSNTYQLMWYENTTQGTNAWVADDSDGLHIAVPASGQGNPQRTSATATKVVFGFTNRTDGTMYAKRWIDMFDQPINITRGVNVSSGIATEQDGRSAIVQGIFTSVIGAAATTYTDQQVYTRLANGTQYTGTFDKVAVYGNQRWLFNYITNGESPTGMPGIGVTTNVWENQSLTSGNITYQVSKFINSTKL